MVVPGKDKDRFYLLGYTIWPSNMSFWGGRGGGALPQNICSGGQYAHTHTHRNLFALNIKLANSRSNLLWEMFLGTSSKQKEIISGPFFNKYFFEHHEHCSELGTKGDQKKKKEISDVSLALRNTWERRDTPSKDTR